ncbi:MAG: hypothetical protein KDC44_15355, partial [Phaeodactylibacter sp.]|nr:hypothetical protein [Phaeodactylibacter sp.]
MKKLTTLLLLIAFLARPVFVHAQNGELDPNFGNNGFLYTNFEIDIAEYFLDMIVLPNDQFVMVGYINHANSHDLLIARFNSDGTIDGSFGEGGYTTLDIQDDSNDEANGVAVLDDGKLLVVGNTFIDGSGKGFILRLNADGSLDTSFGEGGNGYTLLTAGTEFYTGVEDIYVVSNNEILVAGTVSN